jgi:hypothetical protein
MGNLLKFAEYDHLQPKQKPTKYTEIGGFSILEKMSVKELIQKAAQVSGKSKKELKNYYSSIECKDGNILDFCNNYTNKITKTCFDIY